MLGLLLATSALASFVSARPAVPQTGSTQLLTNRDRLVAGFPVLSQPRRLYREGRKRQAGASQVPSVPEPSQVPGSVTRSVCANTPTSSFPLSCSADAVGADTCCTTSPGGHILFTQFWDSGATTSTGPADAFTYHGAWPDKCDGTYEQYCDPNRQYTNITAILQSFGETELLADMKVNWPDYQGNDDSFWSHEQGKHQTCISTLNPECIVDFVPTLDVKVYFKRSVEVFKTLPTYDWLKAAGILPSLDHTYTLAEIQGALETAHGGGVNVNCNNGVLTEIWYHYLTQGSFIDGAFVPAPLVGSLSTCPATSIKYYPKYVDLTDGTSTLPTTPGSIVNGAQGRLFVKRDGVAVVTGENYVTAKGKWYASGTQGTFTLKEVTGGSFIISSSQGPCTVSTVDKLLGCAAGNTGTEFVITSDGTLTNGGSSGFSGAAVPVGQGQTDIYNDASKAIKFTLAFVPK